MSKNIKLKCEKCQYEKEVMEKEVMDLAECPICHGNMMIEWTIKNEITVEEINDAQDGYDMMLLDKMKADIKECGEDQVWSEINLAGLEVRMYLIPAYFEAKRLISEEK